MKSKKILKNREENGTDNFKTTNDHAAENQYGVPAFNINNMERLGNTKGR